MLVLTAMIWGSAFVAQLMGTTGDAALGSFTFTAVRFFIGAAALLPVAVVMRGIQKRTERKNSDNPVRKGRTKATLKAGIICGAVLYVASVTQQFGIVITNSAGKAGFITGLYIVLVPIAGSFFGRKPGFLTWVGAVSSCAGLYFLSASGGGGFGVGDIVLLVGAVMWTVHILVVDRYSDSINPLFMSVTQLVVCGVLSGVSALIFEKTTAAALVSAAGPILYCGVVAVGLAYTLQGVGQKHVAPAKAAIIFSLEAVFSAITAYVVVHEALSLRGYFGCALIFAGILMSQLKLKKSEKLKKLKPAVVLEGE